MNLLQEDQKKLIQDFQQRIIKSKAESYQFFQPTVQGRVSTIKVKEISNNSISEKENRIDSDYNPEFQIKKERRNRLIVPSIKSFEDQRLSNTMMTLEIHSPSKKINEVEPNKFNNLDVEKIRKPSKNKKNSSKIKNTKKLLERNPKKDEIIITVKLLQTLQTPALLQIIEKHAKNCPKLKQEILSQL